MGINSSRDAWVYNSSKAIVYANMKQTVSFYNEQVDLFIKKRKTNPALKPEQFIDNNPQKISWSSSLIPNLERGNAALFEPDKITFISYRPFFKQQFYNGDKMIHRKGQFKEFFPKSGLKNELICISSVGANSGLSILMTNGIADLHFNGDTQAFPLYYFEERQKQSPGIFDIGGDEEYIRRDGISDFILDRAQKQYGKNVSKEDIFYYVYGFLHSPEYRETFANDLKKMLPRLPLVEDVRDFWAFSKAGRKLADLHINYESVPPLKSVEVQEPQEIYQMLPEEYFRVEKMRFPKKDQKDTIIYNSRITVNNIPDKAYEYIVNGKSAIEWIMERYQVTVHKESGIRNDPNDWSKEVGNDRYILDLLLSIINVSVQTVEIVEGLPKVRFEQ